MHWRHGASGSNQGLTNALAYRLSDVFEKPFVTDKGWLEEQMRSQVFSFLKDKLKEAYDHLINTYPPGNEYHERGLAAKAYYENGGGWDELQQSSDDWVGKLVGWFSGGYQSADKTVLDTTDLGGPARGISASELGNPYDFSLSPIFRASTDAQCADLFRYPSTVVQNINAGLESMGLKMKYTTSSKDAGLTLSTSLADPVLFSDNQFEFDTSQTELELDFWTKNLPQLPGDAIFRIGGKVIYNSEDNSFKDVRGTVSIQIQH